MMWRDRRVIVAGGTAGFGLVLARHLPAPAPACSWSAARPHRRADGARGLRACRGERSRHCTAWRPTSAGQGRATGSPARPCGCSAAWTISSAASAARAAAHDPRHADDELREYLDANLFAATEITRAVADDVAAARGHLGLHRQPRRQARHAVHGALRVAKSALAAYADAVRLELGPRGGHVLLVSPGPDPPRGRRSRRGPRRDRYAKEASRPACPTQPPHRAARRALRRLDPNASPQRARRLPATDSRTRRAPQGRPARGAHRVVPRRRPAAPRPRRPKSDGNPQGGDKAAGNPGIPWPPLQQIFHYDEER